jgi:hypothetical protein
MDRELHAWWIHGEHGLSSEAMVDYLLGLKLRKDYPYDPSDLRRCRLLYEKVTAIRERFSEMASCSPVWARMVEHWQQLCDLMDAECPQWRTGHGEARKTYELMIRIRKEGGE